jgi:ketosteroid isomerase-like protein
VLGCRTKTDTSRETEALLNTDREWSRIASTGRNADSVVAFWTDDARVSMPNAPVVRGKAALHDMVAGLYAAPGFQIKWTPETAVVASSGDLGYTTGTNELSVPDSTGKVSKMVGRYITVWRRDAEGRWRCIEDYSTPSPPEAKPRT